MKLAKHLFLLLAVGIFCSTDAFAQAVGTRFTVGTVTYQITERDLDNPVNDKVSIYQINGSGTINIPSSVTNPQDHESYKVTSVISWVANQIARSVREVVLPEGLLSIPDACFDQCQGVKKITIPSTCTSIGIRCFRNCGDLQTYAISGSSSTFAVENGVLFEKNKKTLVYFPCGRSGDYRIPNGVTTIRQYAFSQCVKLQTLTIPTSVTSMYFGKGASIVTTAENIKVESGNAFFSDIDGVLCNADKAKLYSYPARRIHANATYKVPDNVREIAPDAFYVSSVKTVNLNNVETIGEGAFAFSYGLQSVYFSDKVKTIGEGAFAGCDNLNQITVSRRNPYFKASDNVIFSKNGRHLVQCATNKMGDYNIPSGVTDIDAKSFFQCNKLGNVKIPNTVKTIGKSAFSYSGLNNLSFEAGATLESIGENAFDHADISNIILPASLKFIDGTAFTYMKKLTSITVEDGSLLANVGDAAFANNPELRTFTFAGSADYLTRIPEGAFSNDVKLESFKIPKGVSQISKNAFLNTPKLENLTFEEGAVIQVIEGGAFASCGMKSIELPQSVRQIKSQAFDNCTNLRYIWIPKRVDEIQTGALNMCESLEDIEVDEENQKYASFDGMLCNKSKTELILFHIGKADERYTLVPGFTKIDAYAFYGSKKVTNITFPETVTTIDNRAIALCENLKSISFMGTDNVPTLTSDILYKSGDIKDVTIYVRKKWYEDNPTTVSAYNGMFKTVHPSFVTRDGYSRGTEYFPTSPSSAGVISFYNPRTSVIIDKTVTENSYTDKYNKVWPTKQYTVSSILDNAYRDESLVQDIVVLADVGVIGLDAFKAGSQLKNIYFVGNTPATLNSIGYKKPSNYPFNADQNVYVKKSKVSEYQTKWEGGANTPNITYEIPQVTYKNGCSSVCYPFDVKFPSNQGNRDIRPYVPVDFSRANDPVKPIIKMRSIDNYYVPANVGVLIGNKGTNSVTSYCQIDEGQSHDKSSIHSLGYNETNENCMVGAVEDMIINNTPKYQYYAFSKSKGQVVKLSNGVNFPHFKSYFRLKKSGAAKAFTFLFEDEFETIEKESNSEIENISNVETEDDSKAPYYNLNGMRVEKPTKGIYIRNGKKVVIK